MWYYYYNQLTINDPWQVQADPDKAHKIMIIQTTAHFSPFSPYQLSMLDYTNKRITGLAPKLDPKPSCHTKIVYSRCI